MTISVFDLFKVGIGPSSSHTVGPMKAAGMFARGLADDGLMPQVATVRVALYGSLGLTGPGHGSDKAVLLGLEGEQPATVEVDAVPGRLDAIAKSGTLRLLGEHEIPFTLGKNLEFNRRKKLGYHPNGMRFTAYGADGASLRERAYYAVGGRVVTAPTNGAAGIIPAVLHYYDRFVPGASADGVARFLLTAAAIGTLFKENASISGAEVGCQGEVGSACSMAAGALAEVLGGTPEQVENAAEIGIEHNLGLTCDPIGGLVQVPCIERNAVASVTAINAARLALRGDGSHFVSLDKAIATMRATGRDMHDKYKETSRGGLAVNVIEC